MSTRIAFKYDESLNDTWLDEALLLQAEIADLKKPKDRVIEAVKHFFEMPQHIFGGKAKTLFEKEATNGHDDLVALKAPLETDVLSNFLRSHWYGEVKSTSNPGQSSN